MATNQISASVLAFDRRLSSSNAIFYGLHWDKRKKELGRPLPVQEKSVRGVIDHRLKGKEASQSHVEANIENPNLQTVDYCTLGMDEDTLRVRFNIQLAGKIEPSSCNNPEMSHKLEEMVESFSEAGYHDLCRRYVHNLANGRFLWRNRLGAEQIEVSVKMDGKTFIFDSFSTSMAQSIKNFRTDDEKTTDDINTISSEMAKVLTGHKTHVNLEVNACAKKFPGLEVYPSQELVTDNTRGKGKKSKHLFIAEAETGKAAALHPQKITNAIHTIDDWYEDGDSNPISINSYGVVTNQGRNYRKPGVNDFYTLFDKSVQNGLDSIPEDEQKYVMAQLIRGGVFGAKGD